MIQEHGTWRGERLPKLDRVLESLRQNPNVFYCTKEENIIPPERGTAQWVTIYVAPVKPTTDPDRLNRLASNLTDLKITEKIKAYTYGETEEDRGLRYASFTLVEDIGTKISQTTTTLRFFDQSLQDLANPVHTDEHITTLHRKIKVYVVPHQKVAEYLHQHEEEIDQGDPKQSEILYRIQIKDLTLLINGQDPLSL